MNTNVLPSGRKVLNMNDITVICPYIFETEILHIKELLGWKYKSIVEEDTAKIGSDLMYQKLWKKAAPDDVFILHADMQPVEEDWLEQVKHYAEKYPEAGMLGCKLIYPTQDVDTKKIIQSAGGCFNKFFPDHFGSGLDLFSNKTWKDELEEDTGQYDNVREVAWTTFGGVLIKREVIEAVGDFDPSYEWSYNRDTDYCLAARQAGFKIYQIPVEIYHFESKDNKRLKHQNHELAQKESRNLQKLINKWKKTGLMETINKVIE
jgi:GT2 family glycosyltransferase